MYQVTETAAVTHTRAAITQPRTPSLRIAYLVGQFPRTSHVYFWREVNELRRLGLAVDFCSTVHPNDEIAPHPWAKKEAATTPYLTVLSLRHLLPMLWILLGAGPRGWYRALAGILRRKVSLKARVKLLGSTVLALRLLHEAHRRGWTHVHATFCNDTADIAVQAFLLRGLRYSISLHGAINTFGPDQRERWRNAAFGTVITRLLFDDLQRELAGNLPPRLEIAPMGIPVENFTRTRKYMPYTGDGPARLFTCGRIVPDKGIIELLDTLAEVRARGIDARLTITGEPFPRFDWYLEKIEQKLDEFKLRPFVTITGPLDEARVRDQLEDAHVFVLASHYEGLGVVIMEAMAMDVPVIATDAGGVPELVRHGFNGLLVPPRDPLAMANAIVKLLTTRTLADEFSQHSREHIIRHFSVAQNAAIMLACFVGS